jgi:hypothetical protein
VLNDDLKINTFKWNYKKKNENREERRQKFSEVILKILQLIDVFKNQI